MKVIAFEQNGLANKVEVKICKPRTEISPNFAAFKNDNRNVPNKNIEFKHHDMLLASDKKSKQIVSNINRSSEIRFPNSAVQEKNKSSFSKKSEGVELNRAFQRFKMNEPAKHFSEDLTVSGYPAIKDLMIRKKVHSENHNAKKMIKDLPKFFMSYKDSQAYVEKLKKSEQKKDDVN